jgi:hypothetical protein
MGWKGQVYTGVWWGRSEGKEPFGKPRCRRGNNIKMGARKVGGEGMDWINLVQDRDRLQAVVNAVRNFGFHKMRGIS